MEAQPKRCRRCLLQDMADENDYYASVVRYRATMPRPCAHPGCGIHCPAGTLPHLPQP